MFENLELNQCSLKKKLVSLKTAHLEFNLVYEVI